MKPYKSVLPRDPEFKMPSDDGPTRKKFKSKLKHRFPLIPLVVIFWAGYAAFGYVHFIRPNLDRKEAPPTFIQTGQDIDSSGLYICVESNSRSQIKQYQQGQGQSQPPTDNMKTTARRIEHGASLPSTCKANEDVFFKTR